MMIEFILFTLSVVLIVVLMLICLLQKADIEELKRSRDRMREMYCQECARNIEKLKEDIFRDDLELLNKIQ